MMPALVYSSHCFCSLYEHWTNSPAKTNCSWSTQPSWLLRGRSREATGQTHLQQPQRKGQQHPLNLQEDAPELKDNKGFCGGNPALFQHTQLFVLQKDANPYKGSQAKADFALSVTTHRVTEHRHPVLHSIVIF